jgi:hypothetical protein
MHEYTNFDLDTKGCFTFNRDHHLVLGKRSLSPLYSTHLSLLHYPSSPVDGDPDSNSRYVAIKPNTSFASPLSNTYQDTGPK